MYLSMLSLVDGCVNLLRSRVGMGFNPPRLYIDPDPNVSHVSHVHGHHDTDMDFVKHNKASPNRAANILLKGIKSLYAIIKN